MVVAPMRLANCRSASGGMASSFSATRNQDGCDFQAGTPITSPKVLVDRGCWTANITLALRVSTSAAKWLTKSGSPSRYIEMHLRWMHRVQPFRYPGRRYGDG